MPSTAIPTEISDLINARVLSVSEDRLAGFVEHPFRDIAALADVPEDVVHERLAAMLAAGTIRRIRQTLMATNLAPGALVAWRVPQERLDSAFEYMSREDPFSGHVVIRSTDGETPGSAYRLWTTVKVPQRFSMRKHCELLAQRTGAEAFRLMPAKRLFVLGVGHMRRRGMPPGSKTGEPGQVIEPVVADLSYLDWQVLGPLKREFTADEIGPDPWRARADEAGLPYQEFLAVARSLDERDIPVPYTNVFWGGRSEIKPSEVSPVEYERWCVRTGVDPETMRAGSD